MADAWRSHADAAGFTVHVPTGWQVQSGQHGEVVVSEPRGAAAALLRFRNVPAAADLVRWLERDYAGTEPGLHSVRMLSVERREPRSACAVFDYGSHVFQGRARVVGVQTEDRVTLFIAAAARSEFTQRLPALTQILGSFRFDPSGPNAHLMPGEHFPLDDFLRV